MADKDSHSVTMGMFYGVVITGAPRETTSNDVEKFFGDCSVREVQFSTDDRGWRTSNNIYVQLETANDFENACRKDGHLLRSQKVGVLTITKDDYQRITGGGGVVGGASLETVPDPQPSSSVHVNLPLAVPQLPRESGRHLVRLRGLPYSAMASDILDFLKDVEVLNGEKGVHFSFGFDGRVSGEAYVEVCSADDVERALKHDRDHLGGRYIEIFRASQSQFEWECRGAEGTGGRGGGVVRLRGLPYGCSKDDIRDFLQGIAIAENGITVQTNENGRETGEAFVELANEEDVERALDRHKKVIGHRYIEVFRTTQNDIKPVADRWAKYSRPSPYPTGRSQYNTAPSDPYHKGAGYKFGGGSGTWKEYEYDRGYSGRYNTPRYPAGGRDDGYRPSNMEGRYGGDFNSHGVGMRGLPFSASERDLFDFFYPLVPLRVVIEKDTYGRASGEGEAFFHTHEDAVAAMRKDRGHIGSRYVELFLHSKPSQYGTAPAATAHPYEWNQSNTNYSDQSKPQSYTPSPYPAYYVATTSIPVGSTTYQVYTTSQQQQQQQPSGPWF